MSTWNDPQLIDLFTKKTPLIDVRAPVEFNEGHLPNAVNLPLMNDSERHQVGICYKEQGQSAAIELGHKLVSGDVKAHRIADWIEYLKRHPEAQVYCFRGGLRSQISCEWMTQAGIKRTPIVGGYKRLRQFCLSLLNEAPLPKMIRLGGLTGSGKTDLLVNLPGHVDLEGLAHHRGSAFGSQGAQPSQITFENELAIQLIGKKQIIIEDESLRLGKITLPKRFFEAMKLAPLVVLDTPLEERLVCIHRDYVLNHSVAFFLSGVDGIHRKLGGALAMQLKQEICKAYGLGSDLEHHEDWITILLKKYYDPMYEHGLLKQKDQILFRGSRDQVRTFLHTP